MWIHLILILIANVLHINEGNPLEPEYRIPYPFIGSSAKEGYPNSNVVGFDSNGLPVFYDQIAVESSNFKVVNVDPEPELGPGENVSEVVVISNKIEKTEKDEKVKKVEENKLKPNDKFKNTEKPNKEKELNESKKSTLTILDKKENKKPFKKPITFTPNLKQQKTTPNLLLDYFVLIPETNYENEYLRTQFLNPANERPVMFLPNSNTQYIYDTLLGQKADSNNLNKLESFGSIVKENEAQAPADFFVAPNFAAARIPISNNFAFADHRFPSGHDPASYDFSFISPKVPAEAPTSADFGFGSQTFQIDNPIAYDFAFATSKMPGNIVSLRNLRNEPFTSAEISQQWIKSEGKNIPSNINQLANRIRGTTKNQVHAEQTPVGHLSASSQHGVRQHGSHIGIQPHGFQAGINSHGTHRPNHYRPYGYGRPQSHQSYYPNHRPHGHYHQGYYPNTQHHQHYPHNHHHGHYPQGYHQHHGRYPNGYNPYNTGSSIGSLVGNIIGTTLGARPYGPGYYNRGRPGHNSHIRSSNRPVVFG